MALECCSHLRLGAGARELEGSFPFVESRDMFRPLPGFFSLLSFKDGDADLVHSLAVIFAGVSLHRLLRVFVDDYVS